VLELEVTNPRANRIRDLDQRKVPWKIMREINFVNINYRPSMPRLGPDAIRGFSVGYDDAPEGAERPELERPG
jgi:hypothetical protein